MTCVIVSFFFEWAKADARNLRAIPEIKCGSGVHLMIASRAGLDPRSWLMRRETCYVIDEDRPLG